MLVRGIVQEIGLTIRELNLSVNYSLDVCVVEVAAEEF